MRPGMPRWHYPLTGGRRPARRLGGLDPYRPVRAALAACRSRLAYLLFSTGHPADGLVVLTQARSDQELLAGAPGAANNDSSDLANTIERIGNLLSRTGRPAESEVQYQEALAIYQKLVDGNPAVPEFRLRLAFIHNNLGEPAPGHRQAGGFGSRVP